jgi:enhancer of polycomb-like protein
MATRKVRHKKLSVKTLLPILREDELDSAEYEAITTETQLATGVEQAEENVSLSPAAPGVQPCHVRVM